MMGCRAQRVHHIIKEILAYSELVTVTKVNVMIGSIAHYGPFLFNNQSSCIRMPSSGQQRVRGADLVKVPILAGNRAPHYNRS